MNKDESLEQELIQQFKRLGADGQKSVLKFAKALGENGARPRGNPPTSFRRWIGAIPAADLKQIRIAVEEDCENIDPNAW